jgi:NADPH-dependent glutamate synthase beta subunit-like oxidoreductase
MPAIDEEIEEAQEEDIKLEYLAAPIGFNKDGNKITSMQCIRMELGEPDDSGRRRPVPQEGSEFEIPATMVIPAISQEPDFTGLESLIEGRDWIKVNDEYESTKVENVWAGGDATNLALVTDAIGHGRYAAEAIDRRFRSLEKPNNGQPIIKTDRMQLDHYPKADRLEAGKLPVEARFANMDAEANLALSEEQAIEESKRCMSCGYCMDCEKCWLYCQDQAIEKPMQKGQLYDFKLGNCTGCKKCAEICPCGFIDME